MNTPDSEPPNKLLLPVASVRFVRRKPDHQHAIYGDVVVTDAAGHEWSLPVASFFFALKPYVAQHQPKETRDEA